MDPSPVSKLMTDLPRSQWTIIDLGRVEMKVYAITLRKRFNIKLWGREKNLKGMKIVFNGKILRGNRSKKFREVEFDAFESVFIHMECIACLSTKSTRLHLR